MVNFHNKVKCVLCSSIRLTNITNFPKTPIANQLFKPSELPPHGQDFVPINLCLCLDCNHIQIDTLVDPYVLFADYPYVSNSSESMARRLDNLAEKYISKFHLRGADLVLEIGSNDGYLLSKVMGAGCEVLGIDPAINATNVALASGVPTIVDYFSGKLASSILEERTHPKLIIANNVLAHSDSLRDIFEGISLLMNSETTAVIEFSYVVDVFEKLLFDTIYHEHTSYHSIAPLQKFLKLFGLTIFDVERFDAHGGSARAYIKKFEGSQLILDSVKSAIEYENAIGIHEARTWKVFNSRLARLSSMLSEEIEKIKARGESLLGYGVPAKFTSLFHMLGLKEINFDFIVDDNPLKIGKLAPGTGIIISAPEDIPKVDNVVIFSWNYSTSIVDKIRKMGAVSNSIVIPLPEYKVIKLGEDLHNR